MVKTSIVGDFINSEEIKLFDSEKFPVTICEPSNILFKNTFKKPFILVNNLELNKESEPEIEKVTIEYLERLGLRIVLLRTRHLKIRKNYPSQITIYLLEPIGRVIPNSTVLNHLPKDHSIELDVANNRIRLKGRDAYPYIRSENASRWVEIKDE